MHQVVQEDPVLDDAAAGRSRSRRLNCRYRRGRLGPRIARAGPPGSRCSMMNTTMVTPMTTATAWTILPHQVGGHAGTFVPAPGLRAGAALLLGSALSPVKCQSSGRDVERRLLRGHARAASSGSRSAE